MSIASQFNATKDLYEALGDMTNPNLTVRAIASRKAEEAFQRLVKARGQTDDIVSSLDFRGEVPVITTSPRPDMSRKSRVEAVS
ncbi:hypothetical protein JZX87_09860 [Agrobacterium sp. Ap1]|uniref:hypothetical protein n=1 Tax=Agrobacterium sp. Ap1 TaxID=2815337 RepID=UPI001A8EAE31|nr:hypothetical protein [Agrobacterium sp. Ap1]MBO0141467.1 hypothetical protein [Agrobacterium sp. Ap1]